MNSDYRLSPKRLAVLRLLATNREVAEVARELRVTRKWVNSVRRTLIPPEPVKPKPDPEPELPKPTERPFVSEVPRYRQAISRLEKAGHVITESMGLRMDGRPVSYGRLIELAEGL
jgi:hypothetical protein